LCRLGGIALFTEPDDEDVNVPAVDDVAGEVVKDGGGTTNDGGELWKMAEWPKLRAPVVRPLVVGVGVEDKEARRVKVAKAAEEDGVGGDAEPAPAGEGRMN
jgi:hypothetical protein